MQKIAPLALLAATLAACGGGSGGATRSTPQSAGTGVVRPVAQSDLQIADLLYTDSARVPVGFYTEPTRYDTSYLTISQLRNTDLDSSATPPHELCSTDAAQALAWSESVATLAPIYGDLVETTVSDRYFEFVRALRVRPARHTMARIYKCGWLDRTAVNLTRATGPAGTFGVPTWTADDLRGLDEYLYTFSVDNNAGRVVLQSAAAGTDTHALFLGRLIRTTQGCDQVEVWRQDLTAERATGHLTLSETLLWSFGAQRSNGVTQLCP